MKRRRTASERHEAWWAWRKRIAEENFPDICTCYMGKPYMKQAKPCKNCEICPGCTLHIKLEYWAKHVDGCAALKELGCNLEAEKQVGLNKLKRRR